DENVESLENSSNGIKMKMSSRTEKLSKIENERNGKLREAEDKLRRAKVLEDLEKSMEGFSGSVKYILSQSKSGYLPGICGTVSNILSVEKEYAVAIETAIGGALQNIVTENEEAAKKAINKLKASGAGRATFLPLTAIKGRELKEAGVEKNKGFVGFAWKMVNYDAKYDNIVMSLLGKIVVAENIDFAVDIAKKYNYGFKIVTLDGQLVNAGGSMTGGSVVAGTGLLSRKSEIDSLKKQAEDIRKKIEAADGDYNSLKEEVAALNANLVAVESEIKTCGEDKIRYEAEKKRIKMSLDDIEKSGAESVKQIELLKAALKDAENRSEENRKLFEAAQKELEDAKKKRDELREELSALHDRNVSFIGEISDIKSAISDVEKNIEIKKMAVEQLKNQSVEREEKANLRIEEKQRLIEENERIKEQIKKIQEENAELLSEVAGSEKSIETILKERMKLEGENGKLRSEQKEVSIRKEGLSAELVRQEESKKNYVAENDAIIERMLNDYEMTQTQAEQIAQKVENYTESQKKLSGIRSEIKSLGNVNLSAIEEYKEVSERYEFLKGQLDDVERSSKEIRSLIEKLVGQMKDIFNDKFKRISENFTKIFAELFEGGTGALKLTEGEDVLEAGIEIYAAPPGKIINSLSSLSGGEQALVAIAVYFSMLKESPAPFCILDEIEAALDDVNVNRYVQYLKKMNEYIQFIAVSHRRGTMDNADVLYGVTMQERGVSKILKLDVDEIESKLNMKV
ncbi:MAG: chromosome segregation protein SMC, partial [Oscillospiraceae bacterium]|nr:chromosome segregation protein SMC [Oscillospiraceae bacterium]